MTADILERKLQFFSNTIHNEIEEKRMLAKLNAEADYEKLAKENLKHAEEKINLAMEQKKDEIMRTANREVSHAKVRAMAEYVQLRKEQIDRLFVDVNAMLAKFTHEPEYESYLIQKIKDANLKVDYFIVELSPHDMRFEDVIKISTGLSPELGSSDMIGGFILLNKNRSIRSDYSFKAKLLEAQKGFRYDLQ